MARVLNFRKTKGVHSNAVYIGRSMQGIAGNEKFHNPYKMFKEEQRDYVCEQYRKHLWNQIRTGGSNSCRPFSIRRERFSMLVCSSSLSW